MSDYIEDAIESAGLSSEATQVAGVEYKIKLSSSRGSLERSVTMRSEEDGAPTTGQIVYWLAGRMQLVEDCEDFLDWAAETGREAADHKALDEYRSLVAELDEFKTVLGIDAFESLMTAFAIDQAISRARPR